MNLTPRNTLENAEVRVIAIFRADENKDAIIWRFISTTCFCDEMRTSLTLEISKNQNKKGNCLVNL